MAIALNGGVARAATTPPALGMPPALTAGQGQMAEATVVVDPADPDHLAAAADPYRGTVRIEVTESRDRGHTWSKPVKILPPGAAKSYDPTPLFLPGGRLVVVGGAAALGRPYCQPGSSVFVAAIDEGEATIDIVQPARRAVYVDRPTATTDETSGSVVLSWTESRGLGAECRGLPAAARIAVRQWGEHATCTAPQLLASSGSPAAFGAGLARAGPAVVAAVRELGPGPRSRLTISSSSDGGCTFAAPEVVDEGSQPTATPALSGGFAVGVPSVALTPDGSVSVAWSVAAGPGVATRVLRRSGGTAGGFTALAVPADAAATEVLPTLAADRAGGVWELSAASGPTGIAFLLRRWAGTWGPTMTVATGAGGRYRELGEALGLSAAGPVLATAVPVDGAASSSLVVSVQPVPKRPEALAPVEPTPTTRPATASPTPLTPEPPRAPATPTPRSRSLTARPALSAMAATAALLGGWVLVLARRRSRDRRSAVKA